MRSGPMSSLHSSRPDATEARLPRELPIKLDQQANNQARGEHEGQSENEARQGDLRAVFSQVCRRREPARIVGRTVTTIGPSAGAVCFFASATAGLASATIGAGAGLGAATGGAAAGSGRVRGRISD